MNLLARSLPPLLACAATSLAAQPEIQTEPPPAPTVANRPVGSQRVVRVFDFDHPDLNPGDVPPEWVNALDFEGVRDRPGFPIWNLAEVTTQQAHSQPGSVLLPVSGQNASLRLLPGVLPVFPGADYLVSAHIRTTPLRHARARIVARFLDAAGEPIPGSERSSDLVNAPAEWTSVRVALTGVHENATDIQIDLELVQPAIYDPTPNERHRVRREDIQATAWFDDVTVSQLPRVELATTSPSNIVIEGERPVVRLGVRDLTGERLSARIDVTDDTGRLVDQWSGELGRGRIRREWSPRLPGFGWYRADLTVFGGGDPVGVASVDFVRVANDSTGLDLTGDLQRLAIRLDDRAPHLLDATHDLIERLGVGAIMIPLWRESDRPDDIDAALDAISPVAERLGSQGVDLDFELPFVPRDLQRLLALEATNVPELLTRDRGVWSDYLDPFLDRFGQLSSRWRLGRASGRLTATPTTDAFDVIAPAARDALARLVPGPQVRVSGHADTLPPNAVRELPNVNHSMRLPNGLHPDALLHLADTLADHAFPPDGNEGPSLDLVYQGPDLDLAAPRDAAIEFTFNALAFWRAFTTGADPDHRRLVLHAPWSGSETKRPQIAPRPELAALRNIASRLHDRAFALEWRPAPGVVAWLFEPRDGVGADRGALLVVWADQPEGVGEPIDLRLAHTHLTAHDLYANPISVLLSPLQDAEAGRNAHTIRPTDEPLFIEGVDADLVRFASSFRISPQFFTVTHGARSAELIIHNPFDEPLVGQWAILSPGGRVNAGPGRARTWDIRPSSGALAIPPGETRAIPLRLAFGLLQRAGEIPFIIDADAPTGRTRIRANIQVGVPDVEIDLAYRPAPGPDGPHLVVQARIANYSQSDVSLRGAAFAPGAPRQSAVLPTLPPGRQTTRRFFFREAYADARGKEVLVSFTTAEEQHLNTAMQIDP